MTNEAQVLGNVLSSHPDILPIIRDVREKYNIPEITAEDSALLDILFSDESIDWETVRKDVEERVRTTPTLVSDEYLKIYKLFDNDDNEPPELKNRNDVPEDIRKILIDAYALLRGILKPIKEQIDQYYKVLIDRIIENLMTGKNRAIPEGWLGAVYTTSFLGNKTIVAMIGQLGDPKEISSQFRSKYTETFGHDRPTLNDENVDTARYLSLKLNGMKIKDIVDIYAERHPEEFPPIITSNAYRFEKRKKEVSMKKRIQRLQSDINKLIRDR
ncbi:MAG: hypothetical protein HY863_10940 [Chloroflexi bacterium]|nr:hypothetical protein [Chloroflexota bacterium]